MSLRPMSRERASMRLLFFRPEPKHIFRMGKSSSSHGPPSLNSRAVVESRCPMIETTESTPDLQAIERVRNAHVTALNTDDVEAWVGEFTEDAVQMPPHFPANLGKHAIRAW